MTGLRKRSTRNPSNLHGSRPSARGRVTPTSIARELGPCVYAARTDDDLIKIGYTTDIGNRHSAFGSWASILAVEPGTFEREQAYHRQLRPHLARGEEYYHPTLEVLGVVNGMRARANMPPI